MKYNPFTRRQFLRGVGQTTLLLPVLPSLLPRMAQAQAMRPQTRFLAITGNNGMYPQDFFPSVEATLKHNNMEDVRFKALADLGGLEVSRVLGTQFNPVLSKMNILRGLDGTTGYGNHAEYSPALTGCYGNGFGYSVDAVIAESNICYPTAPIMRALRTSPHTRTDFNMSYSYFNKNNLSAYSSDRAVFQLLFENLSTGSGGSSQPQQSAVDVRKRKVVDMVIEEYRRLMNSTKISSVDRQKVQNYFDLLSDVQGRLTAPPASNPAPACTKPGLNSTADVLTAYRNHMDMIVAAFACGLTKVATMHIAHYQNDPNAVAGSGGPPGSHHHESHEVNSYANSGLYLQFSRWQAARVAEMLTKLEAFKESDGSSLLDNSFVIWTNEMAEGKMHSMVSMPVITAGKAGGAIRTGYYVDYRQRPLVSINMDGYGYYADLGRPYNELFVTAFASMGLAPANYEKNGVQGFGDYTVPSHISTAYNKYLSAGRRNPLPFLYTG